MPALTVTPVVLYFAGPLGGAHPAGQTLTLRNTSRRTLAWQAKPVGWVKLSKTSGSLAPRASQTITVVPVPTNLTEARGYYGWLDVVADVTVRVVVHLTLVAPPAPEPPGDPDPPTSVEIQLMADVDEPATVLFTPSADHATVTDYELRSVAVITGTASSATSLGVPTPNAGQCSAPLETDGWAPGVEYRVELRSVRSGVASAWAASTNTGQTGDAPPVTEPPEGAVTVDPGESIQAAVTANPSGTTFYLTAGTHVQQQVAPKSDSTFIGAPGAVMDGQNVAVYAFQPTGANNVTVQNLEVKNYATGNQRGAFHGDGGANWVVEDCVVHDNEEIGIRMGPGWRVTRCTIYRNGVIGASGFRSHGCIVEDSEFYDNNLSQLPEEPVNAEAAGIKLGETHGATIRRCHFHDNFAKGIWTDHCGSGNLVADNLIEDNLDDGIMIEISTTARYTGNTILRNAIGKGFPSGGIKLVNSRNIEIDHNDIRDNERGIVGNQSNSSATILPGETGTLRIENLNCHDNTIRMVTGYTGVQATGGETQTWTSWNNHFTNNHYSVSSTSNRFHWSGAFKTWAQWQAYGHDIGGSFTVE